MKIKETLLELLYPRKAFCVGCGSMIGLDRNDLCEECRARLAEGFIGVYTGLRIKNIDAIAAAVPYRGPGGGVVRAFKYKSDRVLADGMCEDIARAFAQLRAPSIDYVAAVPMHKRRLRSRGFNQAELLAKGTADRIGAVYADLLVRTKYTAQQVRLTPGERRKNIRGAVAPKDCGIDLRGKTVLLVDDVITTGTTAKVCAKALHDAGAARIYFASFAVGSPKQNKE